MELRAVIVDDEHDAIEVLLDVLKTYCPEIDVVGTSRSAQEGLKVIHDTKPDLVFLDVQMPRDTGFDLLKNVKEGSFQTIFVSAHENHAIEAVKFQALAYLLKPVGAIELIEAVNRVKEAIESENKVDYKALVDEWTHPTLKRIAIPTGGGHRYFELEDIIRVEASKNYSNVFTRESNKPILVSRNLKQFELLLTHRGFLRIHNAHLVNSQHIREYIRHDGGVILLTDGLKLVVGRHYRNQVVDYLNKSSDSL